MAYKVNPGDKLIPTHHVPLSSILRIIDPKHVLFDDRVLEPPDMDLVASIEENGFVGALLLRRDGQQYELIDGRRRHMAAMYVAEKDPECKIALKGIPAVIRDVSDEEAYDLMISMNERAKPYSDMQRAHLIQRAITRGRTLEAACRPFGIASSRGSQLLKLLRTDDTIQAKVEAKEMDVSTAAVLSDVPRARQKEIVEKVKSEGAKLTVDRARMEVDPNAPVPPSTRNQILRFIYENEASWQRIKRDLTTCKAVLAFACSGDRAELQLSTTAVEVVADAERAVREKRKPIGGNVVDKFDDEDSDAA